MKKQRYNKHQNKNVTTKKSRKDVDLSSLNIKNPWERKPIQINKSNEIEKIQYPVVNVSVDIAAARVSITIRLDSTKKEFFNNFNDAIDYFEKMYPFHSEKINGLKKRYRKWVLEIFGEQFLEFTESNIKTPTHILCVIEQFEKLRKHEFNKLEINTLGNLLMRKNWLADDKKTVRPPAYNDRNIKHKINGYAIEEISDTGTELAQTQPKQTRLRFSSSAHIYLGIDFGTSYTKIAYFKDKNNRGVIDFGSPEKSCFMMPSVVYYDNLATFSMSRNNENFKQIRFFKATMDPHQLSYENLRYDDIAIPKTITFDKSEGSCDSFEFLCSVFFLANVIRHSKNKITKKLGCTISTLTISMGIPIINLNEIVLREIYNKALHAAVSIEENNEILDSMSIEEVWLQFKESLRSFDNIYYNTPKVHMNCTMPELFAESIFIMHRNTVPAGFYYVIDIGGGTSDFAFMHKQSKNSKDFWFYCHSANVAAIGDEVRKSSEKLNHGGKFWGEFESYFVKTSIDGKNKADKKNQLIEMHTAFFGGGAINPDKIYQKRSMSDRVEKSLDSIQIKNKISDLTHQIDKEIPLNISVSEKQRLLIAWQLSDPDTRDYFLHMN